VRVALTFDTEFPGRPTSAGAEDRLLAALADAGAKATFFLQGRWVRANPELARRIADAGHLVANHSNYHAPMSGLGDELFRYDVTKAERTIRELTGADPKPWFRCPFGAGMDDADVLRTLKELGYRHVGWDVDPRDWHEETTAADVEAGVLAGVEERAEDTIVLLHGWPQATADALPRVLAGLGGTELVTVDELQVK
jgi:peptidoglycan/xylan/chitin deacetylase (PgdA/CDA1 family)